MQALPKGETAGSWFKRRIALQRVKNRKGPETWKESRGTERELFFGLGLVWAFCCRRADGALVACLFVCVFRHSFGDLKGNFFAGDGEDDC